MIPRRFTNELKHLRKSDRTLEESLMSLRANGASIIECIIAVKEETGCELIEAKRVVRSSKTWHDVVEATDQMWKDIIDDSENNGPSLSAPKNEKMPPQP